MTKTLFVASDAANGKELWITDDTTGGTSLVTNIYPGAGSSTPTGLTNVGGGREVFAAFDGDSGAGTHGIELWVSDGTANGTSLVDDIYPVTPDPVDYKYSNSDPANFFRFSPTQVLFTANASATDKGEVWITNGTPAGTSLLKDISPGSGTGSTTGGFTSVTAGAVFTGTGGLWVTDGTPGSTSVISSIGASNLHGLGNGKAVFTAISGQTGGGVYVTDGTSVGTSLIAGFNIQVNFPSSFAYLGTGEELFVDSNQALWVTNGTSGGTSKISDDNFTPSGFSSLGNGKALFTANDATHGQELWITDGTSGGTSLLDDIYPGTPDLPDYLYHSSDPSDITAIGGGRALFSANDGTHGTELWVSNGTSAGTSMVIDLNPGGNGSSPTQITSLGNGQAEFLANDGTHGTELWVTDGTSAGTSMVSLPSGLETIADFTVLLCYAAGTRIRTPRGDVPIEELREGDMVVTALDGAAVPIVWLGHREVDCARHPKPNTVQPVRVRADAFGPGMPERDLVLSPDHAVYVNRRLIPVKFLIDDDAVAQLPIDRVTYYHLELPRHDIVLAEGMPAESYLDVGDRANFANNPGEVRLWPDFGNRPPNVAAAWESGGCAPLTIVGPALDAVRLLLRNRTEARAA